MSQFTDIIKIINCMPPDMAAKMKQRMMGNPQEVEDAVWEWYKKNQPPDYSYPTWEDWFIANGMLKSDWQAPGTSAYEMYLNAECLLDTPIPADIAEKLGSKPRVEKQSDDSH